MLFVLGGLLTALAAAAYAARRDGRLSVLQFRLTLGLLTLLALLLAAAVAIDRLEAA